MSLPDSDDIRTGQDIKRSSISSVCQHWRPEVAEVIYASVLLENIIDYHESTTLAIRRAPNKACVIFQLLHYFTPGQNHIYD